MSQPCDDGRVVPICLAVGLAVTYRSGQNLYAQVRVDGGKDLGHKRRSVRGQKVAGDIIGNGPGFSKYIGHKEAVVLYNATAILTL